MGTEGAFKKLNEIYGTLKSGAPMKKGYHLPRAQMENADIARIINSTEIQSVLRPRKDAPGTFARKRNALNNKDEMAKLNPASSEKKAADSNKKARLQASKEHNKKHKRGDETFYKKLMKAFEAKAQEAEKDGEGEAEDDE